MSWRSAVLLFQTLAFHLQLNIEGKLRYDTETSTQHHEVVVSFTTASASGLHFTTTQKTVENKRNLMDSADIFLNIFFSFGRIYGGDLAGTPTDQATFILTLI
jgi:hypothetical protein